MENVCVGTQERRYWILDREDDGRVRGLETGCEEFVTRYRRQHLSIVPLSDAHLQTALRRAAVIDAPTDCRYALGVAPTAEGRCAASAVADCHGRSGDEFVQCADRSIQRRAVVGLPDGLLGIGALADGHGVRGVGFTAQWNVLHDPARRFALGVRASFQVRNREAGAEARSFRKLASVGPAFSWAFLMSPRVTLALETSSHFAITPFDWDHPTLYSQAGLRTYFRRDGGQFYLDAQGVLELTRHGKWNPDAPGVQLGLGIPF